jgi:hypothetical protein
VDARQVTLAAASPSSLPGTCAIEHHSRGRWAPVQCPIGLPLVAVSALPDGEAWAVGSGFALHEAGGVCRVATAPAANLATIAMLSPDDGWAAGIAGTIAHWHEGTWTVVPSGTREDLTGIAMGSADDGWLVGGSVALHWDGAAWSPAATPPNDCMAAVAAGPGAGEWWIVGAGQASPPLVLQYVPGGWRQVVT